MKHHSAYSAGRQAYFAGRNIETNPWIYTDTEVSAEMHGKWQAGWFDAQEEHQDHLDAEGHIPDEDGSEAWLRQQEYDPEAFDEMVREDMEGKI